MCESNVYIMRDDKEGVVMESVGSLVPSNGKITLKSIFGEIMYIEGDLVDIDLIGHKIRLKEHCVQ